MNMEVQVYGIWNMYRGLQTKQRCKWSANHQVASRSWKYRGKMSFNSIEFISLHNVHNSS